jgi:hypothetical protein
MQTVQPTRGTGNTTLLLRAQPKVQAYWNGIKTKPSESGHYDIRRRGSRGKSRGNGLVKSIEQSSPIFRDLGRVCRCDVCDVCVMCVMCGTLVLDLEDYGAKVTIKEVKPTELCHEGGMYHSARNKEVKPPIAVGNLSSSALCA